MCIDREAARGAIGEAEKSRKTMAGIMSERERISAQLEYAQEAGNADMIEDYTAAITRLDVEALQLQAIIN